MAYYVIDQTTNELLFVSDFEPPNNYIAEGHTLYTSPISAAELIGGYTWDKTQNTFIPKSNKITKREFIKKFTVQEYSTIKQAASVNSMLDYYWQLFMLAEYIDLADADTIGGIQMLEQAGLLAAGRSNEILNG